MKKPNTKQAGRGTGTLFMLGIFTGLRRHDCATMRWAEVDLHRRLIIRTPHKTAKSKKRVHIGIAIPLQGHLESLKQEHETLCPTLAVEYVHPTHKNRVARTIQRIFKRAGISKQLEKAGRSRAGADVGFHSLRHTYISLHAQEGTSQAVIQQTVGHSNARMTAHYTHTTETAALAAADNFPVILDVEAVDHSEAMQREPVPAWAVELLKSMTHENMEQIKSTLLGFRNA